MTVILDDSNSENAVSGRVAHNYVGAMVKQQLADRCIPGKHRFAHGWGAYMRNTGGSIDKSVYGGFAISYCAYGVMPPGSSGIFSAALSLRVIWNSRLASTCRPAFVYARPSS